MTYCKEQYMEYNLMSPRYHSEKMGLPLGSLTPLDPAVIKFHSPGPCYY